MCQTVWCTYPCIWTAYICGMQRHSTWHSWTWPTTYVRTYARTYVLCENRSPIQSLTLMRSATSSFAHFACFGYRPLIVSVWVQRWTALCTMQRPSQALTSLTASVSVHHSSSTVLCIASLSSSIHTGSRCSVWFWLHRIWKKMPPLCVTRTPVRSQWVVWRSSTSTCRYSYPPNPWLQLLADRQTDTRTHKMYWC